MTKNYTIIKNICFLMICFCAGFFGSNYQMNPNNSYIQKIFGAIFSFGLFFSGYMLLYLVFKEKQDAQMEELKKIEARLKAWKDRK